MGMRLLVVLGVALVAGRAQAEPVTFARAIGEGARHSPTVIEAARARTAADGLARDHGSGLPSVPQATVLTGVRDPRGLPLGPEVVLTVQQEVSFRGLGAARAEAADWAQRAAVSELERARLEGAGAAALEWVALLEAQELLRVRAIAARDAEKLKTIADARATAGLVTGADRALAQAEVGAAKLALLDGEGRATEARLSLAQAMGLPLDATLTAEGAFPPLEATGDAVKHLADAPAIRAADARTRQANAEIAVAHALVGPTFSFGASVWREGSGDKAAAALVSVPLPFFDPARYDTGRQAVLASAAAGRAERLRVELEHQTRLAIHEREHRREVKTVVEESVLAPLRTALATAMTAYAAGTGELSMLLLARRSAFAAEERAITATAEVERAEIRLAALTGTLVPR